MADFNTARWPVYPRYKTLDTTRSQIRLLQLANTASSNTYDVDKLCYRIIHAGLDDQPVYSALSYYWGPPPISSPKAIFLDGDEVKIRPTLYNFLQVLAVQRPEMKFWLDAICINQEDVVERNSQVAMMGKIYSSAHTVYVWLGEADADSDYALTYGQHDYSSNMLTQCMEQLFWRPYWTRMWILQEFGLAQNLILVCGSVMTEWSRLCEAVDTLVQDHTREGWRTLDIFRRLREATTPRSLAGLLSDFARNRCVDKRDRVYSLLSLAAGDPRVVVDYTQSHADFCFHIASIYFPTVQIPSRGKHGETAVAPSNDALDSANKLWPYLEFSATEWAGHLRNKDTDRLVQWLEFKGDVAVDEPRPILAQGLCYEVRIQHPKHEVAFDVIVVDDRRAIRRGDKIFLLYSGLHELFFLILRRDHNTGKYDLIDAAFSTTFLGMFNAQGRFSHHKSLLVGFRRMCLQGLNVNDFYLDTPGYAHGLILVRITRSLLVYLYLYHQFKLGRDVDSAMRSLLPQLPQLLSPENNCKRQPLPIRVIPQPSTRETFTTKS